MAVERSARGDLVVSPFTGQDSVHPSHAMTKENSEPPSDSSMVIKIGGSTIGSGDTTIEDLVELQRRGFRPVVVHGGGKIITEWLERQGVRPKFVRGLRVTDAKTLDVAVAVLTGLVNKALVGGIQALGGRAVGLSGVDGGILRAEARDPDLGHVGTVTAVDPSAIVDVSSSGRIPVVAPVALNTSGDGPPILNVNADLVAGEIAAAMGSERLVMLTDVAGVLDSSRRLIPRVTERQARELMNSRIIAGGMNPKLEACITALKAGASARIADGRRPHILMDIVDGPTEADGFGRLGTRVG